jgi:uncharacterized membrane protein YkoI
MAAKKRSSATRKTGGRKSATKKKSSGARKKSATKKRAGRRYSKGAERKVGETMHEMKRGKLRSGRSGKKVKSRKQAIAIGLSQARKRGAKVPRKKG